MLQSLPSWERGLKCAFRNCNLNIFHVAPLVGAWIEITRNFVGMSGECGNTNN